MTHENYFYCEEILISLHSHHHHRSLAPFIATAKNYYTSFFCFVSHHHHIYVSTIFNCFGIIMILQFLYSFTRLHEIFKYCFSAFPFHNKSFARAKLLASLVWGHEYLKNYFMRIAYLEMWVFYLPFVFFLLKKNLILVLTLLLKKIFLTLI